MKKSLKQSKVMRKGIGMVPNKLWKNESNYVDYVDSLTPLNIIITYAITQENTTSIQDCLIFLLVNHSFYLYYKIDVSEVIQKIGISSII